MTEIQHSVSETRENIKLLNSCHHWVSEQGLTSHSTCNRSLGNKSFKAIDCTGTDKNSQQPQVQTKEHTFTKSKGQIKWPSLRKKNQKQKNW